MWIRSHSLITQEVTKEQLFQLFANVNAWAVWDTDIEYAHLDGPFVTGAVFELKPKKGPKARIELVEVTPERGFRDLTRFPLAKMHGVHEWEETPQGLRLTTTMQVEGPLGFLWRKLVAEGIVRALPTEMLAQIAEAKKYPRTN